MSRWLARWRAALRIARRDAWRNKGRTALVVLLMMLPVAAGTFVIGVVESSRPTTQTLISWSLGETAQARLQLLCGEVRTPVQQDASGNGSCPNDGTDLGELTHSELVAALPTADQAVSGRQAVLPVRTDRALVSGHGIIEVDASAVPGLLGEVDGDAEPGAGQAVLNGAFADRLGVHTGDSVEIVVADGVREVEVVGIGHSTSKTAAVVGPGSLPSGDADGAIHPLWYVTGPAPVTWDDVVTLNQLGLTVFSRDVRTNPPPAGEVYGGTRTTPADIQVLGAVLGVVALGLLEVVLLVGPAFAVGARRTARSLALVAATGGEPADLRRIVLASGLVAGLVAGLTGVALGTAGYLVLIALWSGGTSQVPNLVIPVLAPAAIAVAALLLGLVAALVPARAAARADVVRTLAGRRGEAPVRQRVAWIGLGLGVVGLALGLVAAATSQVVLLLAGVITLELGLVMASGALVAVAGRLAAWFGVAGRFALRDSARHRGRTAPAVAAVLTAVAAASVGLVYTASNDAFARATYRPLAAEGAGLIVLSGWDATAMRPLAPAELEQQYEDAAAAVAEAIPAADVIAARGFVPDPDWIDAHDVHSDWLLWPVPDPQTVCPEGSPQGPDAADERCRWETGSASGRGWAGSPLVDDGTMVVATGLDDAGAAADALAQGAVLTNDPDNIWPDGQVHMSWHDANGEPIGQELLAPGYLIGWKSVQYSLVVPPGVAAQASTTATRIALGPDEDPASESEPGGPVHVEPVGGIVTGVVLDQTTVDHANRALPDLGIRLEIEGPNDGGGILLWILVAAALFVALVATWLSVGLAVADSRADLATLAAVGASPRVRRRITAAQAGVIAVIGSVTGVGTGLLLGYVLSQWQRTNPAYALDWQTVVPWLQIVLLLVALPTTAIAGGWLLTRSRLPVRRRVAS